MGSLPAAQPGHPSHLLRHSPSSSRSLRGIQFPAPRCVETIPKVNGFEQKLGIVSHSWKILLVEDVPGAPDAPGVQVATSHGGVVAMGLGPEGERGAGCRWAPRSGQCRCLLGFLITREALFIMLFKCSKAE